jgi:hypothetical protein
MGAGPSSHLDEVSSPSCFDEAWVRSVGPIAERVGHKGLPNPSGANNCFLNVVLQALWHVHAFRHAILEMPPHDHFGRPMHDKPCITCSLSMFYRMYNTENLANPAPEKCRQALATIYQTEKRFADGEMEDATETFGAICRAVHAEAVEQSRRKGYASPSDPSHAEHKSAPEDPWDVPCNPPCAAHAAFGYEFYTWLRCIKCGASADPISGADIVYPVYVMQAQQAAKDLIASYKRLMADKSVGPEPIYKHQTGAGSISPLSAMKANNGRVSIDGVLSAMTASEEPAPTAKRPHTIPYVDPATRAVCNEYKTLTEKYLLGAGPKVFVFSLVWPSDSATKEEVADLMAPLSQLLDLRRMFKTETDAVATKELDERHGSVADGATGSACGSTIYRLRGLVCYYGRHYCAFMASEELSCWILLDDQSVTQVGSWSKVVSRCIGARYQPVMLFYEQMSSAAPHKPLTPVLPSPASHATAYAHAVDTAYTPQSRVELQAAPHTLTNSTLSLQIGPTPKVLTATRSQDSSISVDDELMGRIDVLLARVPKAPLTSIPNISPSPMALVAPSLYVNQSQVPSATVATSHQIAAAGARAIPTADPFQHASRISAGAPVRHETLARPDEFIPVRLVPSNVEPLPVAPPQLSAMHTRAGSTYATCPFTFAFQRQALDFILRDDVQPADVLRTVFGLECVDNGLPGASIKNRVTRSAADEPGGIGDRTMLYKLLPDWRIVKVQHIEVHNTKEANEALHEAILNFLVTNPDPAAHFPVHLLLQI